VNTESILTFEDVSKVYMKGGRKIKALENVSFSLKHGTLNLISGPSGAGKTTLIYLAGLIKEPSNGKIMVKGINTNNLNDNERANLIRDEIGFIFRRFNLLPNLNVLENVMLPMIIRDVGKAKELLEMVGIKEWDRFPRDLSFEEEQKIALARSLVNDPSLILALEPTGELDHEQTTNFIKTLHKISGITLLMTSDNKPLRKFFKRTYQLENGKLKSI